MKRNMYVVRFIFRFNILISGKIIKEMPGSVASGTPCKIKAAEALEPLKQTLPVLVTDQIKHVYLYPFYNLSPSLA